jgi:hypothetical protein
MKKQTSMINELPILIDYIGSKEKYVDTKDLYL